MSGRPYTKSGVKRGGILEEVDEEGGYGTRRRIKTEVILLAVGKKNVPILHMIVYETTTTTKHPNKYNEKQLKNSCRYRRGSTLRFGNRRMSSR